MLMPLQDASLTDVPPTATSRNLVIQQLRGWAILLVLAQHISLVTQLLGLLPGRVTNSGYLGVELFFVISGFVVTRSLQRGGWNLRHFVVRRLFRLYPALLFFLGICALVWGVTSFWAPGDLPRQLFGASDWRFVTQGAQVLTGTLTLNTSPRLYVHAAMWSLSVEFQFYAALALLAFAVLRAGGDARQCERGLWLLALGVVGYCALARLLMLLGFNQPGMAWLFQMRFDFLAAGTLLALVPPGWLYRAGFGRARLALLLAMVGTVLALSGFRHPWPEMPLQPHNWLELLGYPAALVGFSWAVAVAATMADHGVGRSVVGRLMLWLGDRSYSLYLVHFPILALVWIGLWLTDLRLVAQPWTYGPVQAVLGIGLSALVADACFRWVERPGIDFGSRLLRWHAIRPAQTAPAGRG